MGRGRIRKRSKWRCPAVLGRDFLPAWPDRFFFDLFDRALLNVAEEDDGRARLLYTDVPALCPLALWARLFPRLLADFILKLCGFKNGPAFIWVGVGPFSNSFMGKPLWLPSIWAAATRDVAASAALILCRAASRSSFVDLTLCALSSALRRLAVWERVGRSVIPGHSRSCVRMKMGCSHFVPVRKQRGTASLNLI